MSTKPWDIYAEQLFPSGYGHPLWKPEPNASSGREVFIGDVGWLVEGEFRALFNSMRDERDPVNQEKSVPRDFAVFPSTNLSIGRSDKITRSIVFSRSITADNAQPEATTDAYMRDNFDSWLEFANASDSSWGGLSLRPEDVLFVCGTLKTTQWALAAFQGSAFRNKDGVLSGQLDRTGDVQFSVQIDGQPLPTTHARVGPIGRPSSVPDQCLFIRYYKMKRRLLGREPMQAAAGPHQLPPGPDNSGPDAMSPGRAPRASPSVDNECNDTYYDPVNHLLDYILRTSEADIAIASDLDLTALFRDRTFPDDIPAALTELSPAVDIDEHGIGMILVDHSSAETEIRAGNAEPSTVRHTDVSQKLSTTSSSSDSLEVASSVPKSESTWQNLILPGQDTTYLPASPPSKLNYILDGVDQEAASRLDEYAAALSESTTTGIWDVRHSTTRQELPLRNDAGHRAPVIAPRALPWHHLVMPVPLSVGA